MQQDQEEIVVDVEKNKLKVVVYAISKNESAFVDRWYESMKEADEIYVLDTGSTDDTVERLKCHNINVKVENINPWRFDVARNKSLDLVPLDTDICVCTDLDEVLNKGWRKELESSWDNANRMRYKYNWSLDDNNQPLVTFLYENNNEYNASMYGMEIDEYMDLFGLDEETVKQEILDSVNTELIIGAIAQAEKIECSKDEITKFVEEIYEDYEYESPEEFLEDYSEEEVGYEIIYEKVLDFLYENAKYIEITEKEYNEQLEAEEAEEFDIEEEETQE